MIARLLSSATSLFVCFCAATLCAEAIVLGYVWQTWNLDRVRLIEVLAVARGVDPATTEHKEEMTEEEVSPEEVSYEQIVDQRAMKSRDLELRDLELKNAVDQLKAHQRQLADDRARQMAQNEQYQVQMQVLATGAEAAGRDELRATLEVMKPLQAKDQLLRKLENDELDEVVLLIRAMATSKRAKIIAEFKTPQEVELLGEVLDRLGQGEPEASMIADAAGQ